MVNNPRIAERMQRIEPFYVMDLLARARVLEAQGRSIVHMEIGEPDFVTAAPIIQAGHRALEMGKTHYTPAMGLPELRQAIADHYQTQFGVGLDPARVVVTPGASGALQLILSVLINPGDEVLMTDPGYPCNRHFVELVAGKPIGILVDSDSAYQLTGALVESAWTENTRAVLIASPSNPTGTMLSADDLSELYLVVKAKGGILIVDEIYQELVYGMSPRTALSLGDDLFIVNSFSKYYGMTGWRLGWLVAPVEFIDPINRLAQNIYLSPTSISQYAALAAFSDAAREILEQRREIFETRRDFLLPALRQLGFDVLNQPQGAFYLYANCQALTDDSSQFTNQLLDEAGVAVTPGRDFGHNKPEQHVRFAYTTSLERLEMGIERLDHFLNR